MYVTMCVFVCMSVYVYEYVYVFVCVYICVYLSVNTYACVYVYMCVFDVTCCRARNLGAPLTPQPRGSVCGPCWSFAAGLTAAGSGPAATVGGSAAARSPVRLSQLWQRRSA